MARRPLELTPEAQALIAQVSGLRDDIERLRQEMSAELASVRAAAEAEINRVRRSQWDAAPGGTPERQASRLAAEIDRMMAEHARLDAERDRLAGEIERLAWEREQTTEAAGVGRVRDHCALGGKRMRSIHLAPLELGGSNSIANLFAEAASPTPGFHEKDRMENRAHDRLCAGARHLRSTQLSIAKDWTVLYIAYFGQDSGPEQAADDSLLLLAAYDQSRIVIGRPEEHCEARACAF